MATNKPPPDYDSTTKRNHLAGLLERGADQIQLSSSLDSDELIARVPQPIARAPPTRLSIDEAIQSLDISKAGSPGQKAVGSALGKGDDDEQVFYKSKVSSVCCKRRAVL